MADAGPDSIVTVPPGVPRNDGNSDIIAASVQAAMDLANGHVLYLEQEAHAGSQMGDELPLTPSPDADSTLLSGVPGGHDVSGVAQESPR